MFMQSSEFYITEKILYLPKRKLYSIFTALTEKVIACLLLASAAAACYYPFLNN